MCLPSSNQLQPSNTQCRLHLTKQSLNKKQICAHDAHEGRREAESEARLTDELYVTITSMQKSSAANKQHTIHMMQQVWQPTTER